MNKIYKLVWSKVRNCWVVVSELAKSHTKAPKSGIIGRVLSIGLLAGALTFTAMPVFAETISIPFSQFVSDYSFFFILGDSSTGQRFYHAVNNADGTIWRALLYAQDGTNQNVTLKSGMDGDLISELYSNGSLVTNSGDSSFVELYDNAIKELSIEGNTLKYTKFDNTVGTVSLPPAPYVGINSSGGSNTTGEGATSDNAIAIGKDASATNVNSVALGSSAVASGTKASAVGSETEATGKLFCSFR